ncbi:hypothetical protein FQN54_008299 [Arachnomyces sp. PD_36]|nr:hypothetical protein FQN54_008299 [Arachnomyces sp. PD_36]
MLHPYYRIDDNFDILDQPVHDTHPALLLNVPHPDEPERSLDLSRVSAMAERRVMRHQKVVGLFARVYGTAMVVAEAMRAYGVEFDNTPGGIKFHIKQAEADMASESTSDMLKTIEELYYAIYACLNIEIANVQLCDGFRFDIRKMAGSKRQSNLPAQSHLNMLFQACKEVLRSDEICTFLNKEIVQQHQTSYIHWAIERSAREGYYPKDQVGYRQYILRLVASPDSPAFLKWYGLNPEHKASPAKVIAAISERYLTAPKQREVQKDAETKRDSVVRMENPWAYERLRALSHRESSGAMLNGITVGEYRRIQGTMPLKKYAARGKCICFNYCDCSADCTKKPSSSCPCTARMKVICAAQESKSQKSISARYGDLAEAIFDGLCVTREGITSEQMAAELRTGLDLFHAEVIDYRRELIKMTLE